MIRFSDIKPFNSGLAAIKQKGKWGFINTFGDFPIPCEYESIDLPIYNEKIAVKKNRKWGYINTNNMTVIDFKFDHAFGFKDGFAPVKIDKGWGVINEQGKIIIQPDYDQIFYSSNHVFVARKGKKWGYIDEYGNITLPFIYDSASIFSFEIAYIRIGKKHGFIDSQGKFILELTNSQGVYFEPFFNLESIPIINKKGVRKYDWSIYSNKGELITDSLKYRRINVFHDGLASVCTYGDKPKWGVINTRGELIIPCEYCDEITPFICDLGLARKGIYFGFIDRKNNIKIPFKYKEVGAFYENLAYVSPNRWSAYIINTNGDVILNLRREKTFENILHLCAYTWTDWVG